MKNYCTITDLKYYFPEIENYKWTGENDFDKFKSGAEVKVATDIKNKGFDLRKLQTPLMLIDETLTVTGTGDSFEDTTNRLRLVYNVIATTGSNSFILQGSNDDENWHNIQTVTISGAGESSVVFTNAYKYYRASYTIGTSLNIDIYLVETNYDILFCYKQLELILMNASKTQNDQWWNKMLYFKESYDEQLNTMRISVDENDDEDITSDETVSTNVTTYFK